MIQLAVPAGHCRMRRVVVRENQDEEGMTNELTKRRPKGD
jgi:hypothetical protein